MAICIPPGPKGLPFLGSLLDYGRDPLGFLLHTAHEYGDVVRLQFLNHAAYLLNHPDDLERVLVTEQRNFIKSRDYREGLPFLGNGLLVSDGDFWLRQRRLAQPAFHRQRINAYGAVMVALAEGMLDRWQHGETRDVHHDMMRLALEIAGRTLFGTDMGEAAEEIGKALGLFMQQYVARDRNVLLRFIPPSVPTPGHLRYRRAAQRIDDIVYRMIQERRVSGTESEDLLSMLLHAQDEDGSQMSDTQLRDEAVTLILTGHETTAVALS